MQLDTQNKLKLTQTIAKVLDLEASRVSFDQSRENYPEWDSLKHFEVMTAIESEFKIRFTSEELTKATELPAIASVICLKLQ